VPLQLAPADRSALHQDVAEAPLVPRRLQRSRPGDRIVVLKYLFPLFEPKRWDVVVFRNPSDPTGDAANYIKRLVGLPNEQVLLLDGDVFTAPLGADRSQFAVAHKPEHVQRAVWQHVYDSDYEPVDVAELSKRLNRPWPGPPFEATGFDLGKSDNRRIWTKDGDGPATLEWRWERLPITDWGSYNLLRQGMPVPRYAVSDVRFAAALDAERPASLSATRIIPRPSDSFFLAPAASRSVTLPLLLRMERLLRPRRESFSPLRISPKFSCS
jgi:hypothetical protein